MLAFVLTAAAWMEILNPAQVAQYYFTGYDALLSHMAMEHLSDEDFPKVLRAETGETTTVANLRTAMAELYPGSTVAIRNERNKLHLAITVPGGKSDTWPAQIPQPGPVTYPTVGVLPHEVK